MLMMSRLTAQLVRGHLSSPLSFTCRPSRLAWSSISPVPHRSVVTISKHQGPVKIQRVRVRPRRITWKRAVTWSLGAGLSYFVVTAVLSLFLDLDESEDVELVKRQLEENVQGDGVGIEKDNLENEGSSQSLDSMANRTSTAHLEDEFPSETPEDAWFIPLAFARRMPPSYYSGNDPEWQAYVKFARDKEEQKRLKRELCTMICNSLKASKEINGVLGKNIRCKAYWLDIDYPSGPPPSYERYGLEWAPEYVALLHRPVNPMAVRRVEKALWPVAVTNSALATIKELGAIQYDRLKSALSIGDEKHDPMQQKSNSVTKNRRSTGSKSEKTEDEGHGSVNQLGKAGSGSGIVNLLTLLPEYPQDDQRIKPGLALFRRKLNKIWKPVPPSPPSGSVLMEGLVEYRGSEAMCTTEVVATYVVTEKKWHVVFVNIKRMQPNIQRPRGSPRQSAG